MAKQTNELNREHAHPLLDFLRTVEARKPISFADDGERSEALNAAYTLVSRLETPWETNLRLCMGQVSLPIEPPFRSNEGPASIRRCFEGPKRPPIAGKVA